MFYNIQPVISAATSAWLRESINFLTRLLAINLTRQNAKQYFYCGCDEAIYSDALSKRKPSVHFTQKLHPQNKCLKLSVQSLSKVHIMVNLAVQ